MATTVKRQVGADPAGGSYPALAPPIRQMVKKEIDFLVGSDTAKGKSLINTGALPT
jgi:hypothetical protein